MFQLHQWRGLTTISLESVRFWLICIEFSIVVIHELLSKNVSNVSPSKLPTLVAARARIRSRKMEGVLRKMSLELCGRSRKKTPGLKIRPTGSIKSWKFMRCNTGWNHSFHRGTCGRGPSYFNKIRANSEKKTCQNNLKDLKTQNATLD